MEQCTDILLGNYMVLLSGIIGTYKEMPIQQIIDNLQLIVDALKVCVGA